MRMSVRKDDAGYSPHARNYRAYLNGKLLDSCFTADEELGIAHVNRTDENGKVLLNKSKTGVLTKMLYGRVEIRKI